MAAVFVSSLDNGRTRTPAGFFGVLRLFLIILCVFALRLRVRVAVVRFSFILNLNLFLCWVRDLPCLIGVAITTRNYINERETQ